VGGPRRGRGVERGQALAQLVEVGGADVVAGGPGHDPAGRPRQLQAHVMGVGVLGRRRRRLLGLGGAARGRTGQGLARDPGQRGAQAGQLGLEVGQHLGPLGAGERADRFEALLGVLEEAQQRQAPPLAIGLEDGYLVGRGPAVGLRLDHRDEHGLGQARSCQRRHDGALRGTRAASAHADAGDDCGDGKGMGRRRPAGPGRGSGVDRTGRHAPTRHAPPQGARRPWRGPSGPYSTAVDHAAAGGGHPRTATPSRLVSMPRLLHKSKLRTARRAGPSVPSVPHPGGRRRGLPRPIAPSPLSGTRGAPWPRADVRRTAYRGVDSPGRPIR
jgi:hypothetical protein